MHIENKVKKAGNVVDNDCSSPEEKLNHIAEIFHEQIDDIVMQLKEDVMIDEDMLSLNLLRRVIFISINVYGYNEVADAIGAFLDEAASNKNSIQ